MGEVGFSGSFVIGSGLANEHSTMLPEKQGVLLNQHYFGKIGGIFVYFVNRLLKNEVILTVYSS